MRKFDILFLVESGIGNALEMLYALEYCLHQQVKCAIVLNKISGSFVKYLQQCYGDDVILTTTDNLTTCNLVHSFTYQDTFDIPFENYFYIHADKFSSSHQSETEQALSVVRALYPSHFERKHLQGLIEDFSEKIMQLEPDNKIIIYPGCASSAPIKRWPYYPELIEKIGSEKVVIIGGNDDLTYTHSYYYSKLWVSVIPRVIRNNKKVFRFFKKLGLLKKHAHFSGIESMPNAYFNKFSWGELVSLLRRCQFFIGNDGGISHLAASAGAKGLMLFGPSSVNKNKPINTDIVPVFNHFPCQPCQFKIDPRTSMAPNAILCPYQMRCLYKLDVSDVYEKMKSMVKYGSLPDITA